MLFDLLKRLADNRTSRSWATRMRRKRFALFRVLLSSLPRPLRVLDLGGTEAFWERMGFRGEEGIQIVILNLTATPRTKAQISSIVGDARDLIQFADKAFDVVFSNSLIEHLGEYADQRRMAEEVRRVAENYFVQTPNRYFPIEPHFLFPWFQFLPVWARVWLLRYFGMGWYGRVRDKAEATAIVQSIRLLRKRELIELFPGAEIWEEKVFGLTKSFVAYKGFAAVRPGASAGDA